MHTQRKRNYSVIGICSLCQCLYRWSHFSIFSHTNRTDSSLTLDASELPTVEAVRQQLAARGDRWALALEEGKLLAAVNQTLTSFDHPVASGDEVAFFPPVTGG